MAKPNVLIRSKKAKAEELFNRNQLGEADALFAEISRAAPADVESLVMRGLIHRKQGLLREAEELCRRALKLKPDFAWAHQVLGTALQSQGNLAQAISCYQRAIQLKPDFADACYLLANAQRESDALREAAASYRQAIKLQPDFVEALCNLGAVLTALGDVQEAARVLSKANTLRPNTPQILSNLGNILQRDGRNAEALEKYQRALQLSPDSLDAISNVAALLEKTNRIDEAQVLVDRELPRHPDDPLLLLVAAKLARRAKNFDLAIELLEQALRQAIPANMAGEANMLLGQMYDRRGDADRAFAHLAEGNRLAELASTETNARQSSYLERVRRSHSYLTDKLASIDVAAPVAAEEPVPVFLLGFPRSGTTLLEQILDSHPRLQSLEEKGTVLAMVKAFEEMAQGRKDALAELTDAQVAELRKVYFAEVARYIKLQPGNLLVDKGPLHTTDVHIIWRMFPQAKFILAIRHPCDVCFSCFMQNFQINEAMSSFLTLESTAQTYREVMQTWLDAVRLLPLDYHRVRYEDLVADFETETRALLDFLGVGWNDSVLGHTEHAIKRGTINTASYHQVTQPIYQHAKYRWKRYAKHFESVLPVLQPFIEYFGYAEPADPAITPGSPH